MKTHVNTVLEVPLLTAPTFVSGLRDKEAARAWGEKNGYSVVYFLPAKGRAYADRVSLPVDEQARVIEQRSRRRLRLSESGNVLQEIVLVLLFLAVVLLAGNYLGWPW